MKAQQWVIVAPRHVELRMVDVDPANLKPGEVLVEALCTAVSPGTESAMYAGADPSAFLPGAWNAYPFLPGYAGVGRVVCAGAQSQWRPEDQVVGLLKHASHSIVPSDAVLVRRDPAVSLEHAALVRLASIPMTILSVLRPPFTGAFGTAGVWGLGMIGNLAAQLLAAAGYRVAGIDPVESRRSVAHDCDISRALDPAASDFREQVMTFTAGEGFDLTVDTAGHPPTTVALPTFTRSNGQLSLLTHWRNGDAGAAAFIEAVMKRALTVYGTHEARVARCCGRDWLSLQMEKMIQIQHLLVDRKLKFDPLISHRVRPEQCTQVYEGLCNDKEKWWGAIVDWRQ